MSTTTLPNDFLLKSAKRQLGFKPNAKVSLNDVDGLPLHQRCLSEQLVLMTPLLPFNPFIPLCDLDGDRAMWFLWNTLKS